MNKDFYYYSKQFSHYSHQLSLVINSLGLMYQGKEHGLVSEVYLSLLNRIGINIVSINHLSKIFYEENISSSIALLFRSCISDIFFGHYLLLFKSDINSFAGENQIRNAEFLKYARKVSQIEQYLLLDNQVDLEKRDREFSNILKKLYPDLLENKVSSLDSIGGLKIKNAKVIRSEFKSNPEFFGESFSRSPTEDDMFNRLLILDSQREKYYKKVYSLWRYYAQFQHYAFVSRDFISDDKDNYLYYFIQSLVDCYFFTSILQKDVFQISIKDFKIHYEGIFILLKEYKKWHLSES